MRLRGRRLGRALSGLALRGRVRRVWAERAAIRGEGELLLYRTEGLGAHLERVDQEAQALAAVPRVALAALAPQRVELVAAALRQDLHVQVAERRACVLRPRGSRALLLLLTLASLAALAALATLAGVVAVSCGHRLEKLQAAELLCLREPVVQRQLHCAERPAQCVARSARDQVGRRERLRLGRLACEEARRLGVRSEGAVQLEALQQEAHDRAAELGVPPDRRVALCGGQLRKLLLAQQSAPLHRAERGRELRPAGGVGRIERRSESVLRARRAAGRRWPLGLLGLLALGLRQHRESRRLGGSCGQTQVCSK